MAKLNRFFSELRRRNVLKAGGAYLAASWVLVQLMAVALPAFEAPGWVLRVVIFVLALGLPLMLAFAWAFELTPEGLKRTEDVDPAKSQTKETGRKIQYLIIGLLGLAVIVLAADQFMRDNPARSVSEATTLSQTSAVPAVDLPEDAQAVAVMPFTTSGPKTEVWREGMVSMLTTNLDGMGGLRAIDKRTVLARWRERVPEGAEADLATTLAAARATQASVAVVGDVVSIGETMRISAAVHDTDSGTILGRLQAEGDAGDFMALIDRITVQAVEAVRRDGESGGGAALPVPNVSALTTQSLPALRAYLEGEQLLRQSRFDQAIAPLERAVERDSTFAMAHLRLADAYSWTGSGAINDRPAAHATIREHLRAADRHGDRLPPRETALLDAALASEIEADLSKAGKILQAAVRRFPTDPELWDRYRDVLLYPTVARHVGAEPLESTKQAARKALALDSTMTPAYVSLIIPSIAQGDTAAARRLLAAYDRHAGAGSESRVIGSYEAALDLAYGDSARQAAALQEIRAGALRVGNIAVALALDPGAATLKAAETIGQAYLEETGLYSMRTFAQLHSGQYAKLRAFIQDTSLTSLSARTNRLQVAVTLLGRGAISAASVPNGLTDRACRMELQGWYRLIDCFYLARVSAFRQRANVPGPHGARIQAARSVLEKSIPAFGATGEAELEQAARGYLGLLDGLAALRAGDPAAHAALDAAHGDLAWAVFNFSQWDAREKQIRVLIEEGEPTRALSYAEVIATRDPYGHYLAGRAHEAAGDMDVAREAYNQFVSAWARADADIPALQHAQAIIAEGNPPNAPAL